MPTSQYTGKAGHLAVMGEYCLRGYNVGMPEIDKGDDVFVVNDGSGAMWRLQVKTANPRKQKTSLSFAYRVKEHSIQTAQTPELHFIFVMRIKNQWRFLVMDRSVLRNYVRSGLGTPTGDFRQITIVFHDDGRVIASDTELRHHLEDWAAWPVL